ncbi:hypothetical protein C2G38_2211659 [Gigaspora rosea]|uniref:CCHC-type domain-containing protein n=1 Tax=Gigaspora rosea TaxID=44941 RepID=A0A397UGU1_9GLOM|nr:hypothetical protein C2G38_2211659 [Gigaspora rosea]
MAIYLGKNKEELLEEISKLKRIVHQLEEENKKKDKEISNKDKLISEFDERETKLKTRIREISKSAGNTPKAQDYTTRLVDENERLKQEINTNYNENEIAFDENSLNLYNPNINLEIATIRELANAIDGFVNNTTTDRYILINQIKGATAQIRIKNNNLHRDLREDLIREQRRRYTAEAEHDNEIIKKQELRTNAQNQQKVHHLQQCRGDRGLLEYNRDRLYERYEKWKNKTNAERQNILILNQQILALHNNPPNQRNMALPVGFTQPEFHGGDEDHEDFIDRFISYITLAGVNNDANILTILDRSVKGEAREWYHREFDNKNWELENVLDNSGIGATIAHIRGANAAAITCAVASFPNVPLGLTGAQIIPARNVAEDWTIAGGRPTNAVPVAPNAGGEIGALRQGVYKSVPSFWAKIQKYGDQPSYTPAQKKTHFLSGVRSDIRNEIYRIELELRHGILQQAPSQPRHAPIAPAIPDVISQQPVSPMADIQKMIQVQQKTEYQSLLEKQKTDFQSQMVKQTQVPASQTVEPVRQPRGPPLSLQTEESIENYHLSQYLNNLGIFSAEDLERNYHIKPFQRSRPQQSNVSARIDRVEEGINETRDAVNQLTNQFQKVYIGKCDICGETGHSKKNCPNRQIARSNFNQSAYFKPLTPINFQNTPPGSDNEEDGYDEENNRWTVYDTSEKKTDTGSEFSAINDPAIHALG